MAASEFPWISSNLVDATTGAPFSGHRTWLTTRNGLTMGFVGITSSPTFNRPPSPTAG